jgi:hypothetical protein
VQIRSQRMKDSHEMIGYQADLGEGFWDSIYDESRRNKVLAAVDQEAIRTAGARNISRTSSATGLDKITESRSVMRCPAPSRRNTTFFSSVRLLVIHPGESGLHRVIRR